MKDIYIKLILISIFLNIFCILVCGINSRVVYAAPNSINETMSKEEIMDKYYELKKDNQELIEKYDKLSHAWSDEKIEIEKKKESVDDSVFEIITIGSTIVIVLTSIYGMSLWVIIKHINDKVKKTVAEKAKVEIKHIEKMVGDCKREEKLKKEKKILIISKNKEVENLLENSNLLNQFKKVKMAILGNRIDSLGLAEYDVILFNDINGDFTNNEIKEMIRKNHTKDTVYFTDYEMNEMIRKNSNENAVYFYFNKKAGRYFNSERSDNTNFAKSNSTFVENLIDLMKYQDDVLKN